MISLSSLFLVILLATPSLSQTSFDAALDVGPQGMVSGTTLSTFTGTISNFPSDIPASAFTTARVGSNFTLEFDPPAGTYDILLGFIETDNANCDIPGRRVFSVFVDGAVQLEGFDIFAISGCFNATSVTISGVSRSAMETTALLVRFSAITSSATLSYIRVRTATQDSCVPESLTGTVTEDHAAHSVPGRYPPITSSSSPTSYIDSDGDGMHTVRLDASDSHTHFLDAANNVAGRLISYEWSVVETGEVLSTLVAFSYDFPLGTTRIKLRVVDNACSSDEAETTVTVTDKMESGMYCYFYQGLDDLLLGGTLFEAPLPSFSAVYPSLSLNFASSIPFISEAFVARCTFFLEHVPNDPNDDQTPDDVALSLSTSGTGIARLYKGMDLLLDSEGMSETLAPLAAGITAYELLYRRSDLSVSADPRVSLTLDGEVPSDGLITHDQSTVLPIITSIDPAQGRVEGGTQVEISGYGLFQPLFAYFGTTNASTISSPQSTTGKIFVSSPQFDSAGPVPLTIHSSTGAVSNSLEYVYVETTCDSISFDDKARVTHGENEDLDMLGLATCVTLGPNGLLYIGAVGGFVHVVSYNAESLVANSHCRSEKFVDDEFRKADGSYAERDILGIAFHPGDVYEPWRPLVSVSTLYFEARAGIAPNNTAAWRNGMVERLRVVGDPESFAIGEDNICVVREGRVVSYLPVSNHDHSVNSILFSQEGDLLIAVGGNTNLGLPGYKLGSLWETDLSAAVLVARISLGRRRFNGEIRYSDDAEHYTASKIGGDVDIYATGFRNMFGMAIGMNGSVFGVDNGPNCGFGNTASSCDEFNITSAARWREMRANEEDVPGRVTNGWSACPFGPGRKDKVVEVVEGAFYGHPNQRRGECAWVDPFDDLTGDDLGPPSFYRPPLALLDSGGVTGILQYSSNHFCGALRGDLLVSRFRGRETVRVSTDGRTMQQVSPHGGIAAVEDHFGNVILVRLNVMRIDALRPVVTAPIEGALMLVGAAPRRHSMRGGSWLLIGGYNFADGVRVFIGENECADVEVRSTREVRCRVPRRTQWWLDSATEVRVTLGNLESVLPQGMLYMRR